MHLYRFTMASRLSAIQRSQIAGALTLPRFLLAYTDSEAPLVQRQRDRICVIQQALQIAPIPSTNPTVCGPEAIFLAVRQAFVQAALLVSRYDAGKGVG